MEFPEYASKGQKLNSKQEGPEDRVSGNSAGDWRGGRSQVLELDKLCATSEAGFQPSQRDVSDSTGGQPVQEDVMRDGVQGCAEVEEDQDGE